MNSPAKNTKVAKRDNLEHVDPAVMQLRQDLHGERKAFASLMGVQPSDPRFVQWQSAVAHVVRANPSLMTADRASLFESLRTALSLGLSVSPAIGECYLVPRWNTKANANLVVCQLGYRALMGLMYRSEMVDSVHADVAYRGEAFAYPSGTDPKIDHTPDIIGDSRTGNFDDIVCAYAMVRLRGSEHPIFHVVTRRDLAVARSMTTSKKGVPSTPWMDHAEAMAFKVALSRVAKMLPRHNMLGVLHAEIARETAAEQDGGGSIEQLQQPADDGDDQWVVACTHFGAIGVTPEMLLSHLKREHEDDVGDLDIDSLNRLYKDNRNGVPAAIELIASLKASIIDVPPPEDDQ